MPRPYNQFYDEPGQPLRYLTRTPLDGDVSAPAPRPEPIGGTFLWRGYCQTLQQIRRLSLPKGMRKGYLHTTLSLPAGMQLSRPGWKALIKVTLSILGLPPERVPWLAFRHRGTECDHVHVFAITMTFAGRRIPLTNLKHRCEQADKALSRLLGLEPPRYHDPRGGPRLEVITPKRRQKQPGDAVVARGIASVFRRQQPETFAAFAAALEREPVPITVDRRSALDGRVRDSFTAGPDHRVYGEDLSDTLWPGALTRRFDHARRLRLLRIQLEVRRLLASIMPFRTALHDTFKEIDDVCRNDRQPGAVDGRPVAPAAGAAGEAGRDRDDRRGNARDGASPRTTPGPAGPAGRPGAGAWREPGDGAEADGVDPPGHRGAQATLMGEMVTAATHRLSLETTLARMEALMAASEARLNRMERMIGSMAHLLLAEDAPLPAA